MTSFQLKPVRSLENFKHSSPLSSPERWVFPARTNALAASPPTRLFLQKSQDTQNLLQSPDDVFSSPPVPPRVPPREQNFFGATPFVVGGGHNENGDPVFLVANNHTVDVVKLKPPTCSPRKKVLKFCFGLNCVCLVKCSESKCLVEMNINVSVTIVQFDLTVFF